DPLFLERMPFFHAAPGGGVVDLPLRSARAFRKELEGMQHDLHPLRSDTIHLLRARLYQELVKLARRYRTIRGDDDLPAPHPVTSRYRALVERNASRWHGVAEYARELAVSPGYLNTLCRRHLGRNAKELITHQLVLEARRQLCYSRRSAAEIARALGFKDPSYFSRFLVQQTGRSPRHFRTEQDLLARNPSRYTREQLIETRRA
ncbi:MAG: helix-turn-helix domain-containing protein, partial [Gemmatimonadales bacterium]